MPAFPIYSRSPSRPYLSVSRPAPASRSRSGQHRPAARPRCGARVTAWLPPRARRPHSTHGVTMRLCAAQSAQSCRCRAPLSAAPGAATRRASRDASPTSAWGKLATTRSGGAFCRLSPNRQPLRHCWHSAGGCVSSSFLLLEAASAMA